MTGATASTLFAFLAAGSLVAGASLPVLRSRFFEHRLSMLIGFSAGLMLATALHELLPQAWEIDSRRAIWGAAGGFMALYVAERLTHFHACRHRRCAVEVGGEPLLHHHHGSTRGHADVMAMVGMSLHNVADGLTTAAAFAVSPTVGLVVLLAIQLHQLAAGLSLGAIMLKAGRDRSRALLSTVVVASFIVWGALLYHLAVPVGNDLKGLILGIAGGSFLYVAACDLLPEAHAEDEGWSVTAMTLAGYGFALMVTYFE